jgi:hypothetical protein
MSERSHKIFSVRKLNYLVASFVVGGGGGVTGGGAGFPVGAGMCTGRPYLSTKMSYGT